MTPRPRIFVLVLNWNNVRDTVACVDSVLEHEPGVRVVVIDNGSDGDDAEHLRGRFPEVKVIENPHNLGFAGGCNPGIVHALGEGATHVGLLNNDALLDRPVTGALRRVLDRDPRAGAVAPLVRDREGTSRTVKAGGRVGRWIPRPVMLDRPPGGDGGPYRVDFVSCCAVLFPARVFEEVGLLDDGFFFYHEDVDYGLRLADAGWESWVHPGVAVRHRGSATSGGPATPFSFRHLLRGNRRLREKHYRGGIRGLVSGTYVSLLAVKMAANALVGPRFRGRRAANLRAIREAWRNPGGIAERAGGTK